MLCACFCYHHSGYFPTVTVQILLCLWVLLLGSCPVFLSGLLSSCWNANLAGGFAGRLRLFFFVVFCWFGFATAHMTTVLCAEFYITDASSHVRTEPLSDIGQTGEKKNWTSVAGFVPTNLTPSHMKGTTAMSSYRGGPHMRSLISIDFPVPEMEPESAHVVSAVSVP